MFRTGGELLQKAWENGYAIGAFNTNNLEITKSIVKAAVNERAPFIFQVSPSAAKYAGIHFLTAINLIGETETSAAGVPCVLHLDHGLAYHDIVGALRAGFSSVMIDGSKHPFEENVTLTMKIVELAHEANVSVEAELGRLVGVEDEISVTEREASMTDPEKAREFVERTGVDSLAVSIGNAHGWYKGKPQLDFDRLKAINEVAGIPLVLHGGSGIPDEDIKKAISLGIAKINIDTEIRDAFKRGVAGFIEQNPDIFDPRKIMTPAMDEMAKVVASKMRLFGSAGRAEEVAEALRRAA
ncbi:MAG: class II fructose-1,6-bisphosphate aldolase [Actinobacteria bacterium]|nr:class II fructose-1,6-bisphosphate aldolase [Actinomycetota bacterium]